MTKNFPHISRQSIREDREKTDAMIFTTPMMKDYHCVCTNLYMVRWVNIYVGSFKIGHAIGMVGHNMHFWSLVSTDRKSAIGATKMPFQLAEEGDRPIAS